MSLRLVAQSVGVSMSTVSRVMNEKSCVAHETAEAVRRCMRELNVVRPIRRGQKRIPVPETSKSVALILFARSQISIMTEFVEILSGVSDTALAHQAHLSIHLFSPDQPLPANFLHQHPEGLLLLGEHPCAETAESLKEIPAVWLMPKHRIPGWGDQVLPDHFAVGEMAAQYLVRRGHHNVVCLKRSDDDWSLRARTWAFGIVAQDLGITVHEIEAEPCENTDGHAYSKNAEELHRDGALTPAAAAKSACQLVEQLLGMKTLPAGVFVPNDQLLPAFEAALAERGVRTGADGDVDLVSCSNLPPAPNDHRLNATIAIRPSAIGRRGLEQLVTRMSERAAAVNGRVSLFVEPILVESHQAPAVPMAELKSELEGSVRHTQFVRRPHGRTVAKSLLLT